jgi:exodeoxyribonuclease I
MRSEGINTMKSDVQNTLYWHDYETWGEVPAVDRPSQFAGIRTDENLNIIGEPLMIYAKPAPDLLPKPEACLITGLVPQEVMTKGVSEAEFIATIYKELAQPGTCGVGYNSIRFDDEVTRYTLYRNFYDPYEREWRNGNSRWDIIDVVRMTRALRPEGIEWPNYENGLPSFKLEMLTAANNLQHEAAHDALSDVYATIAVAKLIKTKQPKLYDYAYRLRDKRFAASLIDIEHCKPLLHISSKFPNQQGNAALVLPLAYHPTNKNSVIAYNLGIDPTPLLDLPVEELRLRLFTANDALPAGVERLALKEIHLNKTPMLVTPSMLDDSLAARLGLDKSLCELHLECFANLSRDAAQALRSKLFTLYSEQDFAPRIDPEQQLYAGFFGDHDRRLMARIRRLGPAELASSNFEFEDPRLKDLLFRYRARNFPTSLTGEEWQQWQEFCRLRLTDSTWGAGLVMSEFLERITALSSQYEEDAQAQEILKKLRDYADTLTREYQLP